MPKVSRGSPSRPDEDAPPSSYPEVAPPQYARADHSFTLQAIMELQKTVAELATKVGHLAEDSKGLGERLDKLGDKVDRLRMWSASIIGGSVVAWFLIWGVTMWRKESAAWLAR